MKQLNRAIDRAYNLLNKPEGSCNIIRINDPHCPFHLECCRKSKKEVQKIRIVLERVQDEDIALCEAWPLNEQVFTKEIWIAEKGRKDFVYYQIQQA